MINGKTEWVLMEHQGPGCITKMWTPFFYYGFDDRKGPNIRVYLDGATAPVLDESLIELVTGKGSFKPPFGVPTARAGNTYLPIPFARSCKVTMAAKPFYYIINYRAYPEGTQVESFTRLGCDAAAADLEKAGKALTAEPDARQGAIREIGPTQPRRRARGQASRRAERPSPVHRAIARRRSPTREPAVDRPDDDLRRRGNRLVSAGRLLLQRGFAASASDLAAHRHRGRHAGLPLGDALPGLGRDARAEPGRRSRSRLRCRPRRRAGIGTSALCTSTRTGVPTTWCPGTPFQDWNYIDIRGQGVFVGDAWTVLNIQGSWWGEGDEKIYVDDAWDRGFPTHFGTGTEDYYGWAGGEVPTRKDEFSVPFLANARVGGLDGRTTGFNICTRTRSLDAIPFTQRLRFRHGIVLRHRHPQAVESARLLGGDVLVCEAWRHAQPPCPLPEAAARPIMSLAEVKARADQLRPPVRKASAEPGSWEFDSL